MSSANQDDAVENKTDQGRDGKSRELTFEHGFGAQDKVLEDDETLTDLGGVSEEAIRDDLLKEKCGDETHSD